MTFLREMTEAEWASLGVQLAGRHRTSGWALVDWIGVGRKGDGGRWVGSSYAHAAAITGLSKSYLSNAHRVYVAFPQGERYIRLSVHAHVTLLGETDPEARRLLAKQASDERWSATQIAEEIRKRNRSETPPREGAYVHVQYRCPKCSHVFPGKGNKA